MPSNNIIEVSDEKYWKELHHTEIDLYCKLLIIDGKDDWRLPTLEDYKKYFNYENGHVVINNGILYMLVKYDDGAAWYIPSANLQNALMIPVRDNL
jgi:hypothetical protein